MIDWEASVGAPCIAAFGEPATYITPDGSQSFSVTGVFDAQFRATSLLDETSKETDSLPVFGVNASQFPQPPAQNGKIVFPAGTSPHSGKTYLIREPRPDSHGIYHLALNEAAP